MLQWSTIVAWMTRRRVNVVGLLEHGEVMGGEGVRRSVWVNVK